MNKSNEIGVKDGKYHLTQEEKDLTNFSKLWYYNQWGGMTGGTDIGCSYDAHMTRNGKTYVIELKDREVPHDRYPTAFIEFDKYADLLQEAYFNGHTAWYICFYTDGKAIVWNLCKERNRPKKTKKNNAKNKGYGSAEHIEAIRLHGTCPIHRASFCKNFV